MEEIEDSGKRRREQRAPAAFFRSGGRFRYSMTTVAMMSAAVCRMAGFLNIFGMMVTDPVVIRVGKSIADPVSIRIGTVVSRAVAVGAGGITKLPAAVAMTGCKGGCSAQGKNQSCRYQSGCQSFHTYLLLFCRRQAAFRLL